MPKLVLFSLFFLLSFPLFAQLPCGNGDVSQEQEAIAQQLIFNYKRLMVGKSRKASGGPTYIAVKPHFIRTDGGVTTLTMQAFNNAIAICNQYFINADIQFYICGTPANTPNYINNTAAYNWQTANFNRDAITNANNVDNAHNIYFAESLGGVAGFSFGATQNKVNNRTFMMNSYADNGITLLHELGHYFNLPHTFNNSDAVDGSNAPDLTKRERVTRNNAETAPRLSANCTTAGDYVCDTPSDSHNLPGGDVTNCSTTGAGLTAVDANGDSFVPNPHNIMSYYFCAPYIFSAGQYARVNAALAINNVPNSNPANRYTLDCAETAQTAPSNLVLTLLSNAVAAGVTISWTDNSSVETGYIIERSTSAASGFVAIAGVDANVVSFTDTKVSHGQTYYYRVKPSNSKANYNTTIPLVVMPTVCGAAYSSACLTNRNINDFRLGTQAGTTLLSNLNSACSPNSYGDFTGLASGTVTPGTTYTFAVNTGYTTGYFAQHIGIWVDANGNSDFTDAGELVFQSTGDVMNGTTLLRGTLTVPMSATTGSIRMRVRSRSKSRGIVEDPCIEYESGETEDYQLYVLPSFRITTPITAICPGQNSFPVAFVTTATPNPGNQYTVQLSDQTGSFASPTSVGSSTGSPVSVTLPASTPPGGGYALRVVGSAPVLTSAATSTFVFSGTIALSMSSLTVCQSQPVTLSATASGQTFSYTFTGPAGVVSGSGNTRTLPGQSAGTQSFSVTAANQYGCTQQTSATLTVVPFAPTLTAGPSATLTCAQTSLTLTATAGVSYTFANASGILGTPGATSALTVSQPDAYSVTVENAIGCRTMLTTTVSSNTTPPSVSINPGNRTLTCATTSLTLTANTSATILRWSDNSTGPTLVVSASGTYGLSVTATNGCTATAVSASVSQNLSNQLGMLVSTTTLSCSTPTALLTAMPNFILPGVATPGSVIYRFAGPGLNQTGSGNQTTVSTAGVYNVTATISGLCVNTAVVTIIGVPGTPPNAFVAGNGTLSCQTPTLSLTAIGGSYYQFSGPGIVSQTDGRNRIIVGDYLLFSTPIPTVGMAVVKKPGTYTVVVTGENGCSTTATVVVTGTECGGQ
jgi:hypothetical protein